MSDQAPERSKSQSEGPGYRHLYKRLLGTSAYVTAGQVALMALNFGVLALLTRFLTLKELGIYMILMQIGRIASLFCQAGATQSSQKFLGRMFYSDPYRLPIIQRRILLMLLAATVVTVAISAGLWNFAAYEIFKGKGIQGLAFFACVIMVTMTLQNYHAAVLRAINHMRESILCSGLIQKALLLAGVAYLIFSPKHVANLHLVLWVWVVSGIISILVGEGFVQITMRGLRARERSRSEDKLPGFREIVFTSLPMAVATGMATIRNSVDVIIVGAVLGPASAGIYGPIRVIGNMILLVSQAIGKSLPATVVAACKKSELAEVERLCRTAANYGALAAVPLALLFIFAGSEVLGFLFGHNFSGHGALVAIIASGVLVKALAGAPGGLLQMTGHHRTVMKVAIVVTVTSVITMPFIAKAFGLTGMVALSSSFLAAQFICLCWLAYNKLYVRTYIAPLTFLRSWKI